MSKWTDEEADRKFKEWMKAPPKSNTGSWEKVSESDAAAFGQKQWKNRQTCDISRTTFAELAGATINHVFYKEESKVEIEGKMRVFFEHARNGDFNAMLKVESMKYVWERARRREIHKPQYEKWRSLGALNENSAEVKRIMSKPESSERYGKKWGKKWHDCKFTFQNRSGNPQTFRDTIDGFKLNPTLNLNTPEKMEKEMQENWFRAMETGIFGFMMNAEALMIAKQEKFSPHEVPYLHHRPTEHGWRSGCRRLVDKETQTCPIFAFLMLFAMVFFYFVWKRLGTNNSHKPAKRSIRTSKRYVIKVELHRD